MREENLIVMRITVKRKKGRYYIGMICLRKFAVTLIGSVLLIFTLLALDDITTGNDSDLVGEYLLVGSNVIILPLLFRLWPKQIERAGTISHLSFRK